MPQVDSLNMQLGEADQVDLQLTVPEPAIRSMVHIQAQGLIYQPLDLDGRAIRALICNG